MAAEESLNVAGLLREHLESASPDVLRAMVKTFADVLMSAEVDAVCGAGYGERSDERTNSRNGYRAREWDTRAGTVELAIPKLRTGSTFSDWLLQHRRRAEQALVSVVATSYLLGVSTRRVEKLVERLGVKQLSKSQVSEMARHLDAQLLARPAATVMTVSSGLAYVPLPATPTYNATKAAVHSFTESLRVQLATSNIQVIELVPPATRTTLMNQQNSDAAMPLEDFLDEVMSLLETDGKAEQILVERVKWQRNAEAEGRYADVLGVLSGRYR
ncbi:SDR family NAD(P)-dependent oxidoreductase [Jidongwangia harbinensis]|uniref:SDR family NAD(P)-dependent oxidoreductase n=1 Tax=Jidongwangia harbinensis TaxID=2878561 RepID=UPI001CD9EBCD|nr:SDR family NAD(P)-dependent oxidoreductase [Jidongwangia harbinensis]MCA2215715.1 SDR family NAD(P)-dependent oxidoreductase [Jidongwangia harbinensis]